MDKASGTYPSNQSKVKITISRELFTKNIKEICCLIGRPEPLKEQVDLFFKKVQGYDPQDFIVACEDDYMLTDWTSRRNMCWPSLREAMVRARTVRLDHENKKMKENERFVREDISPEIRELIDGILERKRTSAGPSGEY